MSDHAGDGTNWATRGHTRRSLLWAGIVTTGAAVWSTAASARFADSVGAAWADGTALTVVAHPDDDLYFINPHIQQGILAGAEVVSVVVTAAEGDGRNVDTDDPGRAQLTPDFAGYSTARHSGLRRAYARMAGLPVDSEWRRSAVQLGGLTVEHDVLAAEPRVHLYFLNVAEQSVGGDRTNSVGPLWARTITHAPTLPSTDLPTGAQQVSRETLINCLAALFERHRPTVIRTLDPDPEHDWGRPDHVVSDHQDHTAVARFTLAAAEEWVSGSGAAPIVEHYRGYANRYWATNLGKAAYTAKAKYLMTYAGADGSPCATRACGDYQLGHDPYRSTHIFSTAQRYTGTANWLVPRRSGALAAYAVLGGQLAIWSQARPGSDHWTGPVFLPGRWINPTLAVAAAPDGTTHVLALRRIEGPGGDVTVEVVHTDDSAGTWAPWRSLGGPEATDPDRRRQREIGVPAAAVDGTGRLWVFVRDYTGGLSVRHDDGRWERLGGGPLQDVPAAIRDSAGTVRVFVPAKKTVVTWRQQTPGGAFARGGELQATPPASGGLTVVESADRRACLYYRKAESGRVLAYREQPQPGRWPGGPADLDGGGGIGPVAALGRRTAGARNVLLAHRNGKGRVTVAVPGSGKADPSWTKLPGRVSGGPALALDSTGRAVLAAVGLDGRLHVARQRSAAVGSTFGGWITV